MISCVLWVLICPKVQMESQNDLVCCLLKQRWQNPMIPYVIPWSPISQRLENTNLLCLALKCCHFAEKMLLVCCRQQCSWWVHVFWRLKTCSQISWVKTMVVSWMCITLRGNHWENPTKSKNDKERAVRRSKCHMMPTAWALPILIQWQCHLISVLITSNLKNRVPGGCALCVFARGLDRKQPF